MQRLATFLLHLGLVVVVFGLSAIHARYIGDYDFVESSRFGWAIGYCAWLNVVVYGLGLPDVARGVRETVLTAVGAAVVGALGVSVVQLLVGDALLPRYVVFGSAVLLVPLALLCALLSAVGRTRRAARDRVYVLTSSPEFVPGLERDLSASPERPASIVGALTPAEAVTVEGDGTSRLRREVEASDASLIVFDAVALTDPALIDELGRLHLEGRRIRSRVAFAEEWLGKVPVADLARTSLFFDIEEVHSVIYGRTKRVLDMVAALVGMVALVVVVPLVLVGNAIGNRGPLWYRQERVGRNGARFTVVKFRTMTDDEGPATWTSVDDPRITRFGKVLRTTRLDELPQAYNIVRGDLSLVGPRPEQPHYVADLSRMLPFYDLRHSVRPGLTGWAQVKFGYAGDEMAAREKLQYDFHYLRRQSLRFDALIVGRTIRTIVRGDGR